MDQWLTALIVGWQLLYGALTDSPKHFWSSGLAGLSAWLTTLIISRLLYRKCSPRFMQVLESTHLGFCIDLYFTFACFLFASLAHSYQDGLWP